MRKLFTALLGVCIVLGCATKEGDSVSLGPEAFDEKLRASGEAVILDVRSAEEFQSGMIANAVNVDFNNPEFTAIIDSQDKEKPYFVYCAKGGRSSKAADLMQDLGFKNVYHLEGGLTAWKNAGLPLAAGK